MLTSSQPLKDVFFCPEESSFYSSCLESLVFKKCVDAESIVEFGTGDGSPVIQALLRTEFEGIVQGFEINRLACQVARSKIKEQRLSDRYIIHNQSLFDAPKPYATYLISNPPYLPAIDNKIYQPFLHGGLDGTSVTKKLLSINYPNVLAIVSSYSNPEGLIDYALSQDYWVSDFAVSPMPFGYYSSEPKVKNRIQELRSQKQAFYSQNLYLLAGVLFTKKSENVDNLSNELIKLITCL